MVNGGDDKQMKEKLSKIKEMENKVEEMQKKMKHIENKINKTSPDNSDLAKEVDKKIDTFEDQLKQFRKVLEEKDLNIFNLNKKVEILEKKYKCEDILKKNQELEKTVALNKKKIGVLKEKIETIEKPEANQFQCCLCEFKSNSKQGLKTHETRKHTKFTEESFPKQCALCSKTFKTKEEIEKHIITHSYKSQENLQFKCNECDFWCPNTESIEAHIKKHHSENVTCGICDYKAEDIDSLETHIATCQIYRGCCDQIYITIPEFKEHIHSVHKGGRWLVKHIFMDPNNSEYIKSETHYSDQLFKKQKK